MNYQDLEQAIGTLINAIHGVAKKNQIGEAGLAINNGQYLHCSKRLQGAAERLEHAHGKETRITNFDGVVEAWTRVKELIAQDGWTKTAQGIDNLPGMKLKVATFEELAAHLVHLSVITSLMASEKRLGKLAATA